ncbi:hypothetical protein BD769DRAFT_1663745 [Suillus cothurnatus]|nr:hypothetical protein BD769DRAFT_1663745 [Suillus cothurnatus]
MPHQPEYDPNAASSDHSSHTSDFNDSASEILALVQHLGPGGLGWSHGQGGPVDHDGNYICSQIYPHYQQRPSPELDPPSQPEDSETLDQQSAKSPVTHSLAVEGSTEGVQEAIESSADMGRENPHIVSGDEKFDMGRLRGLSSLKHCQILSESITDDSHDSATDSELQHRQFACEITNSKARLSSKKQQILADDCDKVADPPVGNNAVDSDMVTLGREIVGVLQAQTAVLTSVLKVISGQ